MSTPGRRSLVTSPSGSLWPSGRPLWQVTAIGLGGGLAALAVPFLPRVLAEPPADRVGTVAVQEASPSPDGPAVIPHTTSAPALAATRTPRETTTSSPDRTTTTREPRRTTTEPEPEPEPTRAPRRTTAAPEPEPTFAPVTVAATDPRNTRIDVQAMDCPTCASGSRIAYVAGAAGLSVPVDGVEVAGRRTLTIVYESDGPRDLFVSVNGGADRKLTGLPGQGDWETPATTSLSITLDRGSNTLLFHNPQGPAPDLDQFRIR